MSKIFNYYSLDTFSTVRFDGLKVNNTTTLTGKNETEYLNRAINSYQHAKNVAFAGKKNGCENVFFLFIKNSILIRFQWIHNKTLLNSSVDYLQVNFSKVF